MMRLMMIINMVFAVVNIFGFVLTWEFPALVMTLICIFGAWICADCIEEKK